MFVRAETVYVDTMVPELLIRNSRMSIKSFYVLCLRPRYFHSAR